MAAALPFVLAGAQAASTYVTAKGQIAAGNAQAAAFDANATQQQQQGMQARNIAIGKAAQQGVENERRAGAIAAAYGAAGIDTSGGSPLEVMSDQATHGELNRQLLVWQGTAEQQSADTQADFYRAQGAAAKKAGYNSALGTLFSGITKIGSNFYSPGSASKTPPKPAFG